MTQGLSPVINNDDGGVMKSDIAMYKKYLLLIAASSLAASMSAQDLDIRMDYYAPDGKRIKSSYPAYDKTGYSSIENNLWTIPNIDSRVARVEFVAPGSEKCPVEYSVEKKEVKVSVVSSIGEKSKLPEKEAEQKINCSYGETITFRVEVPDGELPKALVTYVYTNPGYPGDINQSPYSVLPYSYSYLNGSYAANKERRESLLNLKDGLADFVREEDVPNVWYLDVQIVNEPMKIAFSSGLAADPQYLNESMDKLLLSLYEQKQIYYCNEGICSNHSPSGEATIMDIYGNCHSDDYISNQVTYEDGDHGISGLQGLMNGNHYFCFYGWEYCYSIISTANFLLDNIAPFRVTMTDEELDVIKAQLLTLRANAYFNIMRIYGPRWEDSKNGQVLCAPLETTFSPEYRSPASMRTIADRCYQDLDEAIELFKSRNYKRRHLVEPDINVARAVKMRVAMLCHDWSNARSLGAAILDQKPLMTADDILGGFIDCNDSWIWGAQEKRFGDPGKFGTALYYWGFGHHFNCNGSYSGYWETGPAYIDKDLYNSIPAYDIRRKQFAMRNNLFPTELNNRLPTENLWYGNNVDADKQFFLANNKWEDYSKVVSKAFDEFKPEGVQFPPFKWTDEPDEGNSVYVPFTYGANLKFLCVTDPKNGGGADVCFMRTEEALLSYAEASYMLGDEETARQLLVKLNKTRNSGYTCTLGGKDLFDEIRKYRRIELWGEGHSWFDAKRWNLPLKRNIYDKSDVHSGNWPASYAPEVSPKASNGWRFPVPRYYVEWNSLIDVEKMGYKDVVYYTTESAPAKAPVATPRSEKFHNGDSSMQKMKRFIGVKGCEPSNEMQPFINLE